MAAALCRLALARPLGHGAAAVKPLLAPHCLAPAPAERGVPAAPRGGEPARRRRVATAPPPPPPPPPPRPPPRKDVADMTDAEKLASIAAGVSPACGTRYVELSAAVFGGAVPARPGEPGTRTGRKILRAPLKGPAFMDWYMPAGGPDSHYQSDKRMRWKAKQDAMRESAKGGAKAEV